MTITKNAWAAIVAVFATLAVVAVLLFVPTNSAKANGEDFKTPICHATGSLSNPYENGGGEIPKWQITNYDGHGPDHANHGADIIPPFAAGSHGNQEWTAYPGKNWVEPYITIFNNDCEVPVDEPEEVTPLAPTFSDLCGPDNEVLTTPTQVGVNYEVTESPAGTFTVVALPADDTFTIVGTATWTFVANDAACPTETPSTPPVTPETPVVTPEVPVVTPEVPVETPNEEETPEPDKDKDEPVRNTPPKDVQVIACVNGVWTITVNGEVISESGTCGETPENTVPQTFSETGL